jgi:hypothetical protein
MLFSSQCLAADARFACAVDAPGLKLSIDTAFDAEKGHSLIHFKGVWAIDDPKLPENLRNMRLDSETLTHSWLDERHLMLHVYRETAGEKPFASLDLVIATERADGAAKFYRGTYRFSQTTADARKAATRSTAERQGNIVCSKS